MKKFLAIFAFCFLIFAFSSTYAHAQPAAQHPDKNIKVRGWEPIVGQLNLIEFSHEIDQRAPQLSTLIAGEAIPTIKSLYQVYEWDWATNTRNGLYSRPPDAPLDFATLVGFAADGKSILVPESGYTLGSGLEVFVLYADTDSITLQYTCGDSAAAGYTIHLVGFNIDGSLLAFYNQLDQAGRESLPALKAGARIGTGSGDILVAIRDTGSFMDPRWRNDWWQRLNAASGQPLELTELSFDECGGGGERGCDNPRDGEKDTGCYGATLKKDSPDESSIDWLIRKVKTFFHWGGDGPIEVAKLTIPIEHDLDKLLGFFPGGTPNIVNAGTLESFQDGTLPKLTPPGPPLEDLHQNLVSYLEDFSRGILDVESCEAPGSKDIEFSVPDVWGLKNTAVNLFSYLAKIPEAGSATSSLNRYQTNTAHAEETGFEQRVPDPTEVAGCKQPSSYQLSSTPVASTFKTPVRLAQTGSVLGDPPASGCYGPGLCDKIDAPDKTVCLTGDYGLIGSADDPTQPATEEGDVCTIPDTETRTCTAYDVLGGLPPSPPCPAGPELPVCTVIGETFVCNEDIPGCDNSSTNDLSMPPRISFLGGPEGYTDNIIETYKIFTIPGIGFKNDLFGEGKFDWNYQNVDRQDEKAMYRKLGTVQCLENHVRQVLSLPGHDIVLEEECFDD